MRHTGAEDVGSMSLGFAITFAAMLRFGPIAAVVVGTFGAGYLNIPAALNATVVARQYAMSPALSQDALGNVFIVVDGTLWGTRAVWGTGVTDLRAVWGTDFNQLLSSRAIWGTSVWADRAVWGTSTTVDDLSWTAIYGEY